MKPIVFCLALALACACSKSTDTYGAEKSPPPATSTTTPPANTPPTPPANKPVTPPANKPLTPPSDMPPAAPITPPVATDTGNDPAEIELAANVRKALVGDSSLSTRGKNVVVVVKGGDVTLRGKVPSAEESTRIYDLASSVTGVNNVVNQLEVQP
jgi:hypothetical protein